MLDNSQAYDTLVSKINTSVQMSQRKKLPENQQQVIEALLNGFAELPTQLQITARFIIDHPYEVGVQSMRTLATQAEVHPNSFVRLARHFGFSGYEAMRERFRDFVRSGPGSTEDRATALQVMAKGGGSSAVVSEMLQSTLNNLEQLTNTKDIERLDMAVEWMTQSERVYILGLGSSYALAYNFWYVARMIQPKFILIPRSGSLAMDDIVNINESELLFSMTFQPYRKDVIETQRFAKKQGARIIGLSDSPASPIYREALLGLHAPTHTPQFFHSNVAVVALLETICALLVAKSGEEAIAHVEKFSELRWNSGLYLE